MYFSHIHHPQPLLPPVLARALDYLRCTDFSAMAPGRYDLQGDELFALLQTPHSAAWDAVTPEFHVRYIDIQFLVDGEELIGFHTADPALALLQDKRAEQDIAFVAPPAAESRLLLTPGHFAIFFPGELHRPCRTAGEPMALRKVVVKVAASLLDQD